MKMTKRISAALLALIFALALCACAVPEAGNPSFSPAAQSPTATVKPSAPPETQPPATPEPSAPAKTQPPATAEPSVPAESAPQETQTPAPQETESPAPTLTVSEDGWYDSKEEVALYLHLYGRLPGNYVTKAEAEAKGWTGGSVERYTGEGTAIGGSRFGNYEGLLPKASGRTYTECDIGTVGTSSRGAKRLVFSNDGLIYYTEDHYESFELLYGKP